MYKRGPAVATLIGCEEDVASRLFGPPQKSILGQTAQLMGDLDGSLPRGRESLLYIPTAARQRVRPHVDFMAQQRSLTVSQLSRICQLGI